MTLKTPLTLSDQFDQKVFNAIYSRALVYNTCWEDPAVDRLALDIQKGDTLVVITSAGCNVLDYALTGPRKIHAIDANPRQNALLELKLAGIRHLEFDDFFLAFGHGYHPDFERLYKKELRPMLSPFSATFWDKRVAWFGNPGRSFYYHGLSGIVARLFQHYLKLRPKLANSIVELFGTRDLNEQREIYDARVRHQMWTPMLNWALSRQLTMSMLGVPHPQRKEVQQQHHRGVAGFIRESIEYVMHELPVWTNYFWSVYLQGRYTESCCPEYLKPDNFQMLKAGRADCIELHTCTITDFLRDNEAPVSKFVLLDHMDWMSSYYPEALAEEWDFILRRATPDARVIFRSAHAAPTYLEQFEIAQGGRLMDHLQFHPELAADLQLLDRVHTYAGFHVADVRT